MNYKSSLILKVMLLSAALAAGIKYLAPTLAIPATPTNAVAFVLGPPILLAVALAWRSVSNSRT